MPKMFQIQITEYTFQTMLDAASITQENIDISYYLLKYFGIQLKTTDVGMLIPHIVNHYGIQNIDFYIINNKNSKIDLY